MPAGTGMARLAGQAPMSRARPVTETGLNNILLNKIFEAQMLRSGYRLIDNY